MPSLNNHINTYRQVRKEVIEMKRIRYDLMIKIGNTLRIERVDDIDSKVKGYQKLRIIEEGEE